MRHTRPVVHAVLPVQSLASVEALHTLLGGAMRPYDEAYAFVGPGRTELWHLAVVEDLDVTANRATLYVHVDDPDAVHASLVAAGFDPTPVVDEPWGMREFAIVDAAGNRIRVGRNL